MAKLTKKLPNGGSLVFHIRIDMNQADKEMTIHEEKPWHCDFNINSLFGPLYLFECDYALRDRKMSMNFLDDIAYQQKDIINAELIYTVGENPEYHFGLDSLTMFNTDLKEGIQSAENVIRSMKRQATQQGRGLQARFCGNCGQQLL